MRETIPSSAKQMSIVKAVSGTKELGEWIQDLISVHRSGDKPYYLHIDILQVLSSNQDRIMVLAVYHRVYLEKGE